jgi:hypothetical protein
VKNWILSMAACVMLAGCGDRVDQEDLDFWRAAEHCLETRGFVSFGIDENPRRNPIVRRQLAANCDQP